MLGRGYIRNISESRVLGIWTEKVCVCVCMWETERQGERDRETGRESLKSRTQRISLASQTNNLK